MSSSLQSSPAQITLSWPQDTNGVPSSYTVYRRAPGSTDWGAGKTLAGSATSYVDADVKAGQAYEYRIVKAGSSYTGYGYILTGIEAPLVDSRGKLVLVVDNTVAAPLASELSRLERDLVGDGWEVIRRDVGREDSVANVKAVIKAAYDTDPANVKSVFLFGHIPVPYSGNFNPDGHVDHVGAWPADAFYGDMDGNWTDNSVNFTQTINTDKADAERM
ncbi:MAG TPA: C25 family cysteine peptidase, partial [Opitutaceae bacterium]